MKSFYQFKESLIKEGYKFIRTSKKPFGQRIIAQKSGLVSNKRVLIYKYTKKVPKLPDFSNFLKDFEHFINTSEESGYGVKAGFFLVGESFPKKLLQGFRTVLKHSTEDLRKRVKILQLKL